MGDESNYFRYNIGISKTKVDIIRPWLRRHIGKEYASVRSMWAKHLVSNVMFSQDRDLIIFKLYWGDYIDYINEHDTETGRFIKSIG